MGARIGDKFKKAVAELGRGMAQGVVISPDRAYLRPENRSFKMDNSNLNGDVQKIGSDLKKKLKET